MAKSWPLFFKDSLILGNLESSVAICTLWTPKEKVKVPKSKFAVCGNLYTPEGINYLLKNLLANPKIRYIVLCGQDRGKSGKSLINLFQNGINENGKIINAEGYIDPKIKPKLINRIRKNVELIDLREKREKLGENINNLKEKEPFCKPVVIKEELPSSPLFSEKVGYRVKGKTLAETWLKLLDLVFKFGEEKESEYGIKQKEILNMMAVIEKEDKKVAEFFNFDKKDLKEYYKVFFGKQKQEDVSYTYGERLFSYTLPHVKKEWKKEVKSAFNQIEEIIEHLKRAPFTRRAVASTWKVGIDNESESPPCLTQVSWNIKYGKLYQTAVFRSHDIFGGWPMNSFALKELQRKVSEKLEIDVGPMTIISNSAHIYENNFKQCKKILKKEYYGKIMNFEEDSHGYFKIKTEDGEIVVQHYLSDGRKSKFLFKGKNPIRLYRRILHENLVTRLDHAAYLGKELANAKQALERNDKYIQDKA